MTPGSIRSRSGLPETNTTSPTDPAGDKMANEEDEGGMDKGSRKPRAATSVWQDLKGDYGHVSLLLLLYTLQASLDADAERTNF
jgi:hypothetical protein